MTMEIPCKIGDDVFAIRKYKGNPKIEHGKVSEMFYVGKEMLLCIVVHHIARGYWGKDIFDTYEKAEEYLNANRRST
jgi:hypothetical protein